MKHLIFDFDGTIVNSGPLVFANLSDYADKTEYSWSELRDLSSTEVVEALGISKLDLPKLILKIRGDFKNKLKDQPIAEGMTEAIADLKEKGFELHIVSSNSKENISEFLKLHGLSDAFTTITSFFTIFGKAHGLNKLLEEVGVGPTEAIYIGDETRDIQAAEKVGMRSLAVCWGYNSEKILSEYKPTQLARSPKDMVTLLCKDIG